MTTTTLDAIMQLAAAVKERDECNAHLMETQQRLDDLRHRVALLEQEVNDAHRSDQAEQARATGWVQLKLYDDWGTYRYVLPWDTRRKAVKLERGQVLTVRWPDGSTTDEALIQRQKRYSGSDHGREYSGTSPVLAVRTKSNGVELFVPLESLLVRLCQLPGVQL
jgi:hypothetical protein